jgi:hypothetical protein
MRFFSSPAAVPTGHPAAGRIRAGHDLRFDVVDQLFGDGRFSFHRGGLPLFIMIYLWLKLYDKKRKNGKLNVYDKADKLMQLIYIFGFKLGVFRFPSRRSESGRRWFCFKRS